MAPSIMENRDFPAENAAVRLAENPSDKIISEETWSIADKLLPEKISSQEFREPQACSEVRIQRHANKNYESVPNQTEDVFKV